jgi:hypothetical protein
MVSYRTRRCGAGGPATAPAKVAQVLKGRAPISSARSALMEICAGLMPGRIGGHVLGCCLRLAW